MFKNVIDGQKFRSTNEIWNKLKLNHPMSVGYVTTLIESQTFSSKEEWKEYYYRSGKERLENAMKNNVDLSSQSSQAKNLNGNYGRTEGELREKGRAMYEAIVKDGNTLNLTLAECIYMVKYRVIGETWIGVVVREKNTLKTLQVNFPQHTFKKVDGKTDFRYGVDFEMYSQEELVSAIQVKPLSYLKGFSREVKLAKRANECKNKDYFNDFGVSVHYVYSNNKGEIHNKEILNTLSTITTLQSEAV